MPDDSAPEPIPATPRTEAEQRWLDENRGAMDAWNAYIEANGLPLAAYRQF